MNRREFVKGNALAALGAAAQDERPFARPSVTSPAGFKAGYAEADITPAIGMEQPSGYGKLYHKQFHDPCKVRAAVFDDGARRVALVGVDAGSVPRQLVLEARDAIRKQCGIPPEAVLVGASHSHSSGPVGGIQPGQYDHASPLVRKLAYEMSTVANAGYQDHVRSQIVAAVSRADSSRQPSASGAGSGVESQVAFNRRFRMRNGLSYTHPGQGNPDIIGYAGPVDPEVGVIGSWDRSGRLMGCIVNFACHATTSPQGISANWIYYMERAIRGVHGPDVVVVFLAGASGDITQVDNLSRQRHPNGEDWAKLVGGCVGTEAARVLLKMCPGDLSPLAAASTILNIKRRAPSPERVRLSTELVQKNPKDVGLTKWIFAKEIVMLDALLAKWPSAEVEVQAIQVGPSVFLTNPAELFCQFGLDIKQKCVFPFTWPVELANGQVGYVPTEEALGPRGGGYETRLTSYSNLVPDAGRQMVDAALELSAGLRPGRAPEPPKPAPFTADESGIGSHPWSYGNVPPELS